MVGVIPELETLLSIEGELRVPTFSLFELLLSLLLALGTLQLLLKKYIKPGLNFSLLFTESASGDSQHFI